MKKRIRARVVAICVGVFLVLFTASAPAAPKKPITGKLSKPGYTVIALAANGKASSARTKPRKFKLRPPAKRVTLHLRAKDGTYAGPIVVGVQKRGKRAILGVKAGAKLGKIKVKAGKGYAKLKRKLPKKLIDAKRKARAKKGVPIGAGNFGRVLSANTHGGAPGDLDLDGIADPLDIDNDGDLILDNLDRSTAGRGARAAQAFDCGPNNIYCSPVAAGVGGAISDTVNANASTLTTADIDGALSTSGVLRFHIDPGESPELDCGDADTGLIYCRRNGTGNAGSPFPGPSGGAFDPDGDGFGTLDPALDACPCAPIDFFLNHGATSDQIGTGDVLIERVTAGGVETQFPATLNFVFVTVPALVSYSDTEGNSGTVSYPVEANEPGTQGNGFPVAADSNGDVVLTLTFWRPQRERLDTDPEPGPGESDRWTDIGGLRYQGGPGACPQDAFSTTDPNLTPDPHPIQGGGLRDSAPDQPASAANTLTYTMNVTKCLATTGMAWDPGQELQFQFTASDGADDAGQFVFFKRQ